MFPRKNISSLHFSIVKSTQTSQNTEHKYVSVNIRRFRSQGYGNRHSQMVRR